ncbi:sporulation protein YunB [Cytobacillus purgationiresistens]|uniref:Sporulation protein YunB n=1 Tax=Cytobacillus purgationiresistens TaxID=863449 RepID=A0ABU0AIH8_9BACI|nr:sporulation protein YunB [Cytobacillus purgationiresistens]MDQ0271064.1 sporulation protein YunB [Cytobacillus purgationiresistens]
MKRRRIRRPLKGPLPFKYVMLITFIVFTLLTLSGVLIINKNIEPVLIDIAETRARQFSAQAINDAIAKEISENIDVRELIIKHGEGEETSYSTNPQIYNRVISETTLRVQEYLNLVEKGDLEELEAFKNDEFIDFDASRSEGGIIYAIPLGMATKITLFSNFGPKVPIRFEFLGDVVSNVETKVIETGINNTFIEIYVKINVQMKVIIPLMERNIEVSNSVKIGDLLLPGKVPQYYNGGGKGQSEVNPIIIPEGR